VGKFYTTPPTKMLRAIKMPWRFGVEEIFLDKKQGGGKFNDFSKKFLLLSRRKLVAKFYKNKETILVRKLKIYFF